LLAAETARSAHRPTNNLIAYDLYLRTYSMVLALALRLRQPHEIGKLGLRRFAVYADRIRGPVSPSSIAAATRRRNPFIIWFALVVSVWVASGTLLLGVAGNTQMRP
jgi:hypothetical protein